MREIRTGRVSPREAAERLVNHPEILNPYLFDPDQKMKESIRQRLLKRAKIFCDRTLENFWQLEVADILLVGSNAGYFYHQRSDIDIKIIVRQGAGVSLVSEENLNNLLSILVTCQRSQGRTYHIDRIFIDFSIGVKPLDISGIYSLKDNCWRMLPDPDMGKGISPGELLTAYEERLNEIKSFLAEIPDINGVPRPEDCAKILEYFTGQIVLRNQNIKDYLVYKILNSQHDLKDLAATGVIQTVRNLSL